MNYLDKSKRELIIELKELQEKHNSFMVMYNNEKAEHKQALELLLKSKERFALIIDASEQGIWDWNLENNEVYYSRQWKKQIGYDDHELNNEFDTWVEHLHPNEKENCLKAVQEYIKQPLKLFFLEFRFRHKDGSYRWIHNRASSVKNKEGKLTRMFGTHTDITGRKETELIIQQKNEEIEAQNEEYVKLNEELLKTNKELYSAKEKAEDSRKRLQSVFYVAPTGIGLVKDRVICEVNPKICEMTGYSKDELIGENSLILYPTQEEFDYVGRDKYKQINEKGTGIVETKWKKKDSSIIDVLLASTPLDLADLKKGVTFTALDITERKRIEKELIIAKEKAEESDRLKTAFLHNMSHEIRTPMNAIMGFSSLLPLNYNNKEKLEKFSEIINQRCNDLLDIINDILDIAKIESGQLPVNIEECDLKDLFAELTSFFTEYQKRNDKQKIKFSLQTLSNTSDNLIVSDKVKLKQIFINLIGNAFKFTDTGKIEGGCKLDENHNLIFYVSDTGIGIPPDKQKIVFERFTQLNQGSSKNIGGTGLGLSIVKGLVGLLGGEIVLESEPGKGSTFSFSIPHKTVKVLHPNSFVLEEPVEYQFPNKNILIVEDDFYAIEYLKEILSRTGLNILCALNGKEAVEIASTQPIDLILMDIRLPDMDGYEATYQIKQHKQQLKIIAQTAYASQYEKQKALNAGCHDYISKPIKQNILLSMINKHLK